MKLLGAWAETGASQLTHEMFEPIVVLPQISVLGLEMPTQLRLGLQGRPELSLLTRREAPAAAGQEGTDQAGTTWV
jgi:hypothetical protein